MAIGSKNDGRIDADGGQVVRSGKKVKGGGGGRANLWSLAFAALCLVPFVMVLGNSMLIPVFPKIEKVLNLSHVEVGLLVTAFSLPAGLLIPFAGFVSDRIGRKRIIVPALIVYGVGGLIAGLAALWLTRPFTWVVVGRVIQGIGAGGTYQLAMALAGDLYGKENMPQALGALEASNGLGKVVSPILGSIAMAAAWYVPFFIYGALAIPSAIVLALAVREPEPGGKQETTAKYFSAVKQILGRKGISLLVSFAVGFVALFMLFGLLSYLSDILEERFHLYDGRKGLALAVPVTTMAVTSFLAGLYLQRRTNMLKSTILVGMAITMVSLLATPLFRDPVYFFGVVVLAGLGIGLVLPPLNTLITGAASSEERGIITSVYGTVRFLGVAAGPPSFGAIGFGSSWLFAGAAAVTGLVGALAGFLIDQKQMLADPESPQGGDENSSDC